VIQAPLLKEAPLSNRLVITVLALVAAGAPAARAGLLARIGDQDGFGYGAAPGFVSANPGPPGNNPLPANLHGDPFLKSGDFLPDVNKNGSVATGSGDDFDLRSTAEVNNTANTAGTGVHLLSGMSGSNFTDISLSTSYDASSAAKNVLIGGNPTTGLVKGAGGPFPSPPSDMLPNQPGFVFQFTVDKSALPTPVPIFFNLVFGDYDVTPAEIDLTTVNGSHKAINLMTQDDSTADGLIQAATANLAFTDVFTDGGSVWNGSLKVDFNAPNEPYTAFDYVELSTEALVAVPEPSTAVGAATGAVMGLGFWCWKRRRAAA
jgi:hypothetical protein